VGKDKEGVVVVFVHLGVVVVGVFDKVDLDKLAFEQGLGYNFVGLSNPHSQAEVEQFVVGLRFDFG